jgi:hypothetical protein
VALPFEDDLRVVYDREDEVMIADGSGSEIVKIVLGFQQKEVTIEVFTSSQEKAVFRGVGGNQ